MNDLIYKNSPERIAVNLSKCRRLNIDDLLVGSKKRVINSYGPAYMYPLPVFCMHIFQFRFIMHFSLLYMYCFYVLLLLLCTFVIAKNIFLLLCAFVGAIYICCC